MGLGKNIDFEKKKSVGSAQRTSSQDKKENNPFFPNNLISRDQSIPMFTIIDDDQNHF